MHANISEEHKGHNGHRAPINPPGTSDSAEREMVLVLSNRASIALLAITWPVLLVGLLWSLRRNRQLTRQIADLTR